MRQLASLPIGSLIRLSNGSEGVVSRHRPENAEITCFSGPDAGNVVQICAHCLVTVVQIPQELDANVPSS